MRFAVTNSISCWTSRRKASLSCMPPSSVHALRERLVIACSNPGKLREFRELLADLPFDVVAQGDLGVTSPEETGSSFLENALLKARHAAKVAGAAAISDDSGLEK